MDFKNFLYLSQNDVASLNIEIKTIIEQIKLGFIEMGKGKIEMPPKPGIYPEPKEENNCIHAMPCYIPALSSAGIKWVSSFPKNREKNLPYVSGMLILNDVKTGMIKAVMDCVWLTTYRTAAASVLSARYLAKQNSNRIGVFGCGVQGHANLKAFACEYNLSEVHCYDPLVSQAEKLANYATELGLKAFIEENPKSVVTNMDIIVTAGPMTIPPHATIQEGWLSEGAFVSMVDYDSAWSKKALAEADLFTTDSLEQYLYNKNSKGYFKDCPTVYAELGELVTEKKIGRTNQKQKTFACNLGVASEDISMAPLIYELAIKNNVGTILPL